MQQLSSLYIAHSGKRGRGVFTAKTLHENDLVEICPVIVIPQAQLEKINQSVFHDYYFLWSPDQTEGALALGYGSLYNHSYQPNARIELDFANRTISFYASRAVQPGEELLIDYRDHPQYDDKVWFEVF